MRLRRPTRLAGFSYRGLHRYSLRFCTWSRRPLFIEALLVDTAWAQIQRTAQDESFSVLAYCFMPDHVHLAVEGLVDTSDLRRFVKIAKQRVAYVFRIEHGISRVWQDGYYERVLRSEESFEALMRYILDNPVRAGLVERYCDFPFSGSLYPLGCSSEPEGSPHVHVSRRA